MKDETLFKTGIIGGALAVLCCVTPILVVAVSALGLAPTVPWLDFLLFPALALFLGTVLTALVRGAPQQPQKALKRNMKPVTHVSGP